METGIISVHLYNCLKTAGFSNFDSIFKFRRQRGLLSFLNLKNFGRKALSELEELFSGCYVEKVQISPSDAGMADVFVKLYEASARKSKLFKLAYPSLTSFCQSINNTSKMPTYKEVNMEVNDVTSVWQIVADIINKGLDSPLSIKLSDNQRRHLMRLSQLFTLQIDRNRFIIIYDQKRTNPLMQELLKNEYERIRQTASVRTRNIMKSRLPKYEDALNQYFRGGLATRLLPSCGNKTVAEINTLLRKYFDFAYALMQKDVNEIEYGLIVNNYSFLTDEEVAFVQQFKSEHKHLPMFYILYRHLLRSKFRYEMFYRMQQGLGCKRLPQSEIAKASGLSFERVRQILSTAKLCPSIANVAEWQHYDALLRQRCFSEKSAGFDAVRKEECLGDEPFHAFGALVCAIGGYTGIEIGDECVYVKADIARQTKLKAAIRLVHQANQRRSTATAEAGIESFFEKAVLASLDVESRQSAFQTLREAVALQWGIDSDGNKLIFKKNTINIEDELYNIIAEQGQPAHIETIFEHFKDRHPDHRYTNPSQIRAYLLTSGRIKPIGKSSMFTIDKWEGVYTGTIRQMVHSIIAESDTPLNCHEILNRVQQYFPRTNYNSINTMVLSDSRYCRYVKSTVGIKGRDYGEAVKPVAQSQWKKLSFGERLQRLATFITDHQHVPSASGNDEEQTLMRWYNNIKTNRLKLSGEERELFENTIQSLQPLMLTKSELEFREKCDELKKFVEANRRYPNRIENPRLSNWITGLRRGHTFTGRRAELLAGLKNFLAEHKMHPL